MRRRPRPSLPPLRGADYLTLLQWIHDWLQPRTYLEIGALWGDTLRLASAASIAVDPHMRVSTDVVGRKPVCAMYQLTSDRFFAEYDPRAILGAPVEFAFLDGMHRCEFVLRDFANVERLARPNTIIAIHDCLPTELPMTEREGPGQAIHPDRTNWWTGDVWRAIRALRRYRPDLRVQAFDAGPTGMALVTDLDPASTVISDRYWHIVDDMMSWTLEGDGLQRFHDEQPVLSTTLIDAPHKLTAQFWL